MNKHIFTAVFLLGAATVVWIGAGYLGTNWLALTMTVMIAAVYLTGALELQRFRQATASLKAALHVLPDPQPDLGDWLSRLHPSLHNAVRLRIEGERTGLPGPALTPYLVGLLVMLGMLGTFLGMVVTLNGAVFALEGTTDLQSIRSALAAPIKGLGLAFGTSVAGVAASAMLGLISALSRRERMQTALLLDTKIATVLRSFSLTHQRQETFKALQFQSQALPAVVDKLQQMLLQMEARSQQLDERLLSSQDNFHREARVVYTDLACAVEKSLKDSLGDGARLAGESIKPVLESAMTGMAQAATLMHERAIETTQTQLDGLTARFSATTSSVVERLATADEQRLAAWTQSLQSTAATLHSEWQEAGAQTLLQQQQICTTLEQSAREVSEQTQATARSTLGEVTQLLHSAEELLRSRSAAEAEWSKQHGERMDQLASLWRSELGALRDEEALRGEAAVERLGELQTALTAHLSTLGRALEEPITRLVQTASEAPRAAAEVIGQLREEMSKGIARDNELLEERSRILETLNSLLAAINHASAEQRTTIDALVASSGVLLNRVSEQFAEQVGTESEKMSGIAAHVTSSAVEVASLGESFSLAVQLFNEANEKLITNLQRIEASMDKSMARSDEQLAYYVAQAREIIDLSVMSQKAVFDDLRQRTGKPALLADEVG